MIDFSYTITKFDEVNKIVTVSYEDGQWADIRLHEPLPTTIEQFDDIVRNFTAPYEHMQARVSNADLSFISSNVGMRRTTPRLRLRLDTGEPAQMPNSPAVNYDDLDAVEMNRLKDIIREVLKEAEADLVDSMRV